VLIIQVYDIEVAAQSFYAFRLVLALSTLTSVPLHGIDASVLGLDRLKGGDGLVFSEGVVQCESYHFFCDPDH
jgi:hypothetical protein